MPLAVMPSIIGAVGGAVQSLINSNTAKRNTDLQNRANQQLAEYQYSKDLEMWNRGNVYNDPSSQMERLKKAGLNPNLVYGSGATGNTAGQLPKYNAPTMQYNYTPPVDLPGMIGMFQDIQLRNAQVRNIDAQANAKETLTPYQVTKIGQDNYWKNLISQSKEVQERVKANMQSNNYSDQLGGQPTPFQKYSLESMNVKNRQGYANINKIIQDTEYKRVMTDWYSMNAIAGIMGKGAGILRGLTQGIKGAGAGAKGASGSFRTNPYKGDKNYEAYQKTRRDSYYSKLMDRGFYD